MGWTSECDLVGSGGLCRRLRWLNTELEWTGNLMSSIFIREGNTQRKRSWKDVGGEGSGRATSWGLLLPHGTQDEARKDSP